MLPRTLDQQAGTYEHTHKQTIQRSTYSASLKSGELPLVKIKRTCGQTFLPTCTYYASSVQLHVCKLCMHICNEN